VTIIIALEKLWAERVMTWHVHDVYYDSKRGGEWWLLQKEKKRIRIRHTKSGSKITMKKRLPHDMYKIANEQEYDVQWTDVSGVHSYLSWKGLIPSRQKHKTRISYVKGTTYFEIDMYPWLPPLLEIEAQEEKDIKWYLTAIQGQSGNFDFAWNEDGQLLVTDRRTGETQIGIKAQRRASTKDKAPRYRIKEPDGSKRYIEDKAIKTYFRRQEILNLPEEIRNIRPNVEATIHQVFYHLNGQQSKYRGLIAHRHMVFARCFWTNCRRITAKITQKAKWKTVFTRLFHFSYCEASYRNSVLVLPKFAPFQKQNFLKANFIRLFQRTFWKLSFRR